jgi:hypothetical protein
MRRVRPAAAYARQHKAKSHSERTSFRPVRRSPKAAPQRSGGGAKEGGPFDSSPLRSGGLRFFESDPSRKGRSIGYLRSRGRRRAKD